MVLRDMQSKGAALAGELPGQAGVIARACDLYVRATTNIRLGGNMVTWEHVPRQHSALAPTPSPRGRASDVQADGSSAKIRSGEDSFGVLNQVPRCSTLSVQAGAPHEVTAAVPLLGSDSRDSGS